MTGWRFNPSDDLFDRRERREPVRFVRQFGTGNAREKILRSARKSGNFVRNGRAKDKNDVVYAGCGKSIYGKRYRFGKQAAGYLVDLISREFADRNKVFGPVPSMVEDGAEDSG